MEVSQGTFAVRGNVSVLNFLRGRKVVKDSKVGKDFKEVLDTTGVGAHPVEAVTTGRDPTECQCFIFVIGGLSGLF